jgi:hypothetical protein
VIIGSMGMKPVFDRGSIDPQGCFFIPPMASWMLFLKCCSGHIHWIFRTAPSTNNRVRSLCGKEIVGRGKHTHCQRWGE